MEKIREGQPFSVIMDYTDSPAKLERLFREIRRGLPENRKLLGVICRSSKRLPDEKLEQMIARNCDFICYAPSGGDPVSSQNLMEAAFRRADFGDCVLLLGRVDRTAAREAARQLAYEMGLIE